MTKFILSLILFISFPLFANSDRAYKAEVGEKIINHIESRGLVDLAKYVDLEFKNFTFGHPAFIYILGRVDSEIWRITEGYPVTIKHSSREHYSGRAIDLTIKKPRDSRRICRWINKQKDFKCINEYVKTFGTTRGKHLHIKYTGN